MVRVRAADVRGWNDFLAVGIGNPRMIKGRACGQTQVNAEASSERQPVSSAQVCNCTYSVGFLTVGHSESRACIRKAEGAVKWASEGNVQIQLTEIFRHGFIDRLMALTILCPLLP